MLPGLAVVGLELFVAQALPGGDGFPEAFAMGELPGGPGVIGVRDVAPDQELAIPALPPGERGTAGG